MTNMILPRRLTGALGGGLVAVTLSLAVTGIQAQETMAMASADTQLEEVIVPRGGAQRTFSRCR